MPFFIWLFFCCDYPSVDKVRFFRAPGAGKVLSKIDTGNGAA